MIKNSRKLTLGILFILLCGGIIKLLYGLNVVPNKYLLIAGYILILFNLFAMLFMFLKNKITHGISFVMYLLLTIISAAGLYYGSITNQFLDDAFSNAEETYEVEYYILSKLNITEETLPDNLISYSSELQYQEKVLELLNEKNITNFSILSSLEELLLQDTILLDSSSYIYLYENDTSVFDGYDIIYTFTISVTLSNESIGEEELDEETASEVENLVAGEYYNIFIGGYDFTNTYMDFNMLVTINKTNNEILLTTIPRDYYITDAKVGKKDKLSDMGSRGIETNMASVAKLFGIKIDYYIKVNTKSLVALVDAVGGITYCSDTAYTTTHALVLDTYNDSTGEKLNVIKGCQHLNGIQALTVARERLAFKSGDNQRQKNCAQIMQAILTKMKTPSMITKYTTVLSSVNGFYTTTIPRDLITSSVKDLLENSNWKINTQSVTGYGGNDYIFFGSTKDYVMYPTTSSVTSAKKKIQMMKYKHFSEI